MSVFFVPLVTVHMALSQRWLDGFARALTSARFRPTDGRQDVFSSSSMQLTDTDRSRETDSFHLVISNEGVFLI
jgi:hypothetical protein